MADEQNSAAAPAVEPAPTGPAMVIIPGVNAEDSTPAPEVEAKTAPAEPEAKAEPATGKEAPAPEADADADANEPVTITKAEHARLLKQVKDKETFIQRQGNEVGEARKKAEIALAALKNQLPADDEAERERLVALSMTDPVALGEELGKIKKRREDIAHHEAVIRETDRVEANRARIQQYVPDFDAAVEDVAKLIQEDGASSEDIEAFRANPHVLDPALAFNLHQRAKLSKQVADLTGQIEQLKQENATLKDRPDDMLRRIESAASAKPMTGKTGGAGKETNVYDFTNPLAMPLDQARRAAFGK